MRILGVMLLLCWAGLSAAWAQTEPVETEPLLSRLTPEVLQAVFTEATRVEDVADGGPPAAAAYRDEELVGYVFSTLDVLRAPGYSATPFDVVAGVTLGGRITGAAVLFHREPYLLNDRRRTRMLVGFLDEMSGMEARLGAAGGHSPSFVAGATISARAMRNAVLEGAGIVLRFRTDAFVVTEPTIDMLNFRPKNADELIADGGLVRSKVTNADLAAAMQRAGLQDLPLEVPISGGPDATYLDLMIGYANPPTIGRNGAGQVAYDRLAGLAAKGHHGLILASRSAVYDHRGTKLNNLSHGFRLERISVTQGDRTYEFVKSDTILAEQVLGRVADVLVLKPDSGFDPMQPWRASVHAYVRHPDSTLERFLLREVDYALPSQYILLPASDPSSAWVEPWVQGRWQILVLCAALAVLTAILAFQSLLSRSRVAHRLIRNGFLAFTLVWIGWIASAQLSIVHVINYLKAPFDGFGLAFYLAEPLIVILSVYTAISLLLLGRGVFCGWLCPFGALQELLAQAARLLRLPQWNPPERVQRHMWGIKYLALAIIVALVLLAPSAGAVAEEVEPFKTAITAMFDRAWPYVVYATVLLVIGLFTERAFCRFLCPLGAALAILDRLHLVDLLKRRPECGNPCRLCERACPVRAIERSGRIVMSECFQCLDCQVEYYDEGRCPPLAQARKRRLRNAFEMPKGAGQAAGVSALIPAGKVSP